MRKDLEEWLSKNFCPLIETTGSLVCELKYCANNTKGRIAIAFSRYHSEKDPWEYIIADEGYVLTVPSFWLSIPKELVISYLSYYIDGYMDEYVYNKSSNSNSNNNVNSCPTYPPCHPNIPKPPAPPPLPPCVGANGNNGASGSNGASSGNNTVPDFAGQLENINGSSCPAGGCATGDCESKTTGFTNTVKYIEPKVGLTN